MSSSAVEDIRPFNHTGFNQYLVEHRLMAVRCAACGEIHLPPRALCPRCFNTDMEWIELSGEGRLEGFTFVHVSLPAMAAEGYNRQNPYCSGIVRLVEGPAVAAQIVGEDGGIPNTIQVGMSLRAVFQERASGGATGDDIIVKLAFSPS